MRITSDHVVELDTGDLARCLGDFTFFEDEAATISVVRLPDLPLADGEVVASDGIIMQSFPFMRRLAPGAYEVRLVLQRGGGDERVAFAILGRPAPVASFEMALTAGQDLAALAPGNVYGYPVDTGIGSFAATAAHRALATVDDLLGEVEPVMRRVYAHTRDWCSIEVPEGAAVLFSSGVGDGLYASYFGLDEAGEAALLVTDFGLVEWSRRPVA